MTTLMDGIILDDAQRRVVDHDGGPLLVLGGPGTGKSTVLVERWVRLATSVTQPHRVLLLVPTRERALALRDELPWRLDARAILEVAVHTWHAFAYHLVSHYYRALGYARAPVLLTVPEQWTVVRDLLAGEDAAAWGGYAEHLTSDALVSEVADFCLRAGHRACTDDDLLALADERPAHEAVARFGLRYRDHLARTSTLDYASLVQSASRLFDEAPDVAETVRRRFAHVLVDDAQELAPAQIELLRRLGTDNLVCAGDPDAGVESFRGADPRWLHAFRDFAPSAQTAVLPTCHRHGATIGTVGASLIAHSTNGEHRPAAFAQTQGTAELRCYGTMSAELEAAAREVRSAHLFEGLPYDRMAILLAQPSTYQHALCRTLDGFGVPYRVDAADRPLQAEPAVGAVLDLCRVSLADEPSTELLKRVLASPLVGMHPMRIRELARDATMRRATTLAAVVDDDDSPEAAEFRRLRDVAASDPDEPAPDTFARVFHASAWCAGLADADDPERRHQLESLVALSKALGHFEERRPGGTMRDYLDGSARSGVTSETWTPSWRSQGVHVMSLHASKGLEWDLVCVLGVAEGQIPKTHRAQGLFDPWALELGSAVDRAVAQLAEERRTLYVALTRARRSLVVSVSPGSRRATPSRFLEESFGELPETILPGAHVQPLTLDEAAARLRRTLADASTAPSEKAAAAAALTRIPGLDPSEWWWRRTWTPGPPLTPGGKLTTSYSRIGKYGDCPLRYVLESVLGLDPESTYQMKFGSLVHRIIEDVERGVITSWEQALATYRTEFVDHHRDDYPNTVFARTYYTYGVRSLKRWWRTERLAGETLEVEFSFNDLDVDGHTIRGRIDRVSRQPAGLVLSDYKTSRTAARWDEAKESLQLAIYYLAAKTYMADRGAPAVMELVYPGIEHINKGDGAEECAKRYQKPEQADEAIEKLKVYLRDAAGELFAPSPEADCQWCKMKPLCPRYPEGREVPR